ncbi:hypothetical protein GQL56_28360, partial [Pseudomonas putida]|nr:hypothetical protein [Pseudomonas putida]
MKNNNIYPVYSIRDAVSGCFGQLLVESNEQTARRNFRYGCREGLMNYARDDFSLYYIGSYNVDTGEFVPLPIP